MPNDPYNTTEPNKDNKPTMGDQPNDKAPVSPAREALVKKWTGKISSAKRKAEDDVKRMREDMEFIGGVQHPSQDSLTDNRYRANFVVREVNQSVASMYARNPKAVARRRQRRDTTKWDGTTEQLQAAAQRLLAMPQDPAALAVMVDYNEYLIRKQMLDGLADTLQKEYQVQVDRQEIDFKLQHKQLVRRVKVCGVGYVRLSFRREGRTTLDANLVNDTIVDRAKKVATLVKDYDDQKFDADNEKFEQLRALFNSVNYSAQNPTDTGAVTERIVFDFPSATAVIVDPACKMLKGFVGAKWLAIEYMLPSDEVKAIFGKSDLNAGTGGAKTYDDKGKEVPGTPSENEKTTNVAVWEVLDKQNRERFFICDGYKDFLQDPEELTPCVQGFWPIRAITFNDTESEPGLKISIYPESDVRLMRSAQQSINSAREALRKHQRFNRPKYLTGSGWLTDEDKIALQNPPDNAVIEIKGAAPGTDLNKLVQPHQPTPIDEPVYNTAANENDILKTVGAQSANLGPLVPDATATQASIAEQSRLSSSNSEVDDLDELLTWEAQTAGEMMLREMSKQTVIRDVGINAVWPESQEGRLEMVDRIYLEIQAASAGRPNKGMEMANLREIAPLLLQTGANPIPLIREMVKRWDDRLDVEEFYPVVPPMMPPVQQGQPGQPNQGAANTPNGAPTPQPMVPTDANSAAMNPS